MLFRSGNQCIGRKNCADKVKFGRDAEIYKLIQSRKRANRLYRYWSKKGLECDPEFLQEIWNDYLEKKCVIQEKIKSKHVKNKIQTIIRNSGKGSNNTKAYWRMLRRLNQNNDFPLRIIDPTDNARTIEDPKEICKILGSYWEKLGCYQRKQQEAEVLEKEVCDLMSHTGDTTGFVNIDINFENVSCAIRKLKNGKACGVDQIPNEFLKQGGSSFINALVDFFNLCKLYESYPDQWFQGFIKPIHKEGSKEMLSNYRGITVTSNIYKVFVSLMECQS